MKTHAIRWAGPSLALALLLSPLQAGAQQLPTQQPQLPDSIRTLVQEFQTLRTHLGEVQDSALQATPSLQEEQAEIQAFIEDKMAEEKPGIEADMGRLDELRTQAQEAQAAEDRARMQEIVQEGTQLRNALAEAQQAAMEREDVQARVQAFEDEMMAAMTEIDADIEESLARMEELAQRLQAFQAGG